MPARYYFAASTDSGLLLGCNHEHVTVISAAACVSGPGAYVIAVEKGRYRELNDREETEFQAAMYGTETATINGRLRSLARVLKFKPVSG